MNLSKSIITKEKERIVRSSGKHPFGSELNKGNIESVLESYVAMSQAFPYLQAGSQKDIVLDCIQNNKIISTPVEITSVVGNFLCWDETGGHHVVQKFGNEGLPKIIDTRNFHSNILINDIKKLIGREVVPNFDENTSSYLISLLEGLSSFDPVVRCACMVAFEEHAEIMIESLWASLEKIYPEVNKDSLEYFFLHVGGDDPAEEYHVQMTNKMIDELIPEGQISSFLESFKKYYTLNVDWCKSVC